MASRNRAIVPTVVALTVMMTGAATARLEAQGPPPAVREAVRALVTTLEAGGEEHARTFVAERLTDDYRARLGAGALQHVRSLQEATRLAHGDVGLDRLPDGAMRLSLTGRERRELVIELDEASGRFGRIEVLSPGDTGNEGRSAATNDHLMALERLAPTDAAVSDFVRDRLGAELRARQEETREALRRVARAAAAAGAVMLDADGPYHVLRLRGEGEETTVRVLVGDEPPFPIEELTVESGASTDRPSTPATPIPWEALDDVLTDAESDWGFSGSVLALREGQVVLNEAYGLADREAGRPVGTETVFDIGSQPIDFTRAAIWLLVQRGDVAMNDPIVRFYPDAPADKRAITIEHLMTGASGLPNFHHVASDADWDLSWIDRATAERRILGQPLLFEPGTDRSPSHSAFGLLAAIVERVSGRSYEDVLRTDFFEPLGMARTGPYGDDLGLPASDFAVGYGGYGVGEPNIPPNWGPTSWLIKGSGGMVSTPGDLYRFFQGMLDGEVLVGEAREGYLSRTSSSGATDRGFLFVHAWAGGASRSMILLSQNVDPDRDEAVELRRRLAATVGARVGGG